MGRMILVHTLMRTKIRAGTLWSLLIYLILPKRPTTNPLKGYKMDKFVKTGRGQGTSTERNLTREWSEKSSAKASDTQKKLGRPGRIANIRGAYEAYKKESSSLILGTPETPETPEVLGISEHHSY